MKSSQTITTDFFALKKNYSTAVLPADIAFYINRTKQLGLHVSFQTYKPFGTNFPNFYFYNSTDRLQSKLWGPAFHNYCLWQ